VSERSRRPEVLRRPEQGWSSLLLLLAMLALLGISIVDARDEVLQLASEVASPARSLPILMLAAGLIGFLLARSRIGVVQAHIIGAATGAMLLLLVAGSTLLAVPDALVPEGAISQEVGAVWLRLEEDLRLYLAEELPTPPVVAYLVLGAFCWTTAQFSAFSIFRYGRGGPAVIAIGTVLFLNLGLGSLRADDDRLPVLPLLATFSALAMLLLIRMQLVSQRLQWARRHISDTGEVSRLFLRSGALFVVLTIVSATSLTTVATVEAQDIELGALEDPIKDFGDQLARLLGLAGVPPPEVGPASRGSFSAIDDAWEPGEGIAFTAAIDRGQLRANYWWGFSRDTYDPALGGWASNEVDSYDLPPGAELRTPAVATSAGDHPAGVTITIGGELDDSLGAYALTEASVYRNRGVEVISDDGRSVSAIEYRDPVDEGDRVEMVSYVRDYSDDATTLTANQLRAAGDAYPAWVEDRYLQGQGDERIAGRNVERFVARIRRSSADNAYDRALEVQRRLGAMAYVTDMRGACGRYDSVPECVLAEEKGFCQHYATTMIVVLRELGVPARFITGYLPGQRDPGTGIWTVEQSALHNWVEAYFPGHGWVRFDPTPGRVGEGQTPTDFPEGEATPEPPAGTPAPPAGTPFDEPTPEPTLDTAVIPPDASGGDDQTISYVISGGAIMALLLTLLSVVLLFRLRRLPGDDDGLAYRGVVSLATRLGYGPHPSQTEYEYAGTLSEAIPTVRHELYVVADARVETAYGQRRLDAARRGSLRRAYARIRTALLRLSLRRRR
jgi:transglutaminase-like putative cysteine protease